MKSTLNQALLTAVTMGCPTLTKTGPLKPLKNYFGVNHGRRCYLVQPERNRVATCYFYYMNNATIRVVGGGVNELLDQELINRKIIWIEE